MRVIWFCASGRMVMFLHNCIIVKTAVILTNVRISHRVAATLDKILTFIRMTA